jgi:hypothetical protein
MTHNKHHSVGVCRRRLVVFCEVGSEHCTSTIYGWICGCREFIGATCAFFTPNISVCGSITSYLGWPYLQRGRNTWRPLIPKTINSQHVFLQQWMCGGCTRGEASGGQTRPSSEVSNPAGHCRARTQHSAGADRRKVQTGWVEAKHCRCVCVCARARVRAWNLWNLYTGKDRWNIKGEFWLFLVYRNDFYIFIQGDSGGNVNILGGDNLSLWEQSLYEHVSNCEWLLRWRCLNVEIQKHCEWQWRGRNYFLLI